METDVYISLEENGIGRLTLTGKLSLLEKLLRAVRADEHEANGADRQHEGEDEEQ